MASPTKASKYPPLNFSSVAVPAGGQHFYMAFSAEGADRSCSFTAANTDSHTGEQRILPGQRAGAVLDLTGLGRKNTRIMQSCKTVLQGGDLKAFSVFSLTRRELRSELAIYSQVLGRCFLAEGFLFCGRDKTKCTHWKLKWGTFVLEHHTVKLFQQVITQAWDVVDICCSKPSRLQDYLLGPL